MRTHWLLALGLAACGTGGDGDSLGGPADDGPLTNCEPDPDARPPISGEYEGRFAFGSTEVTTYPLVVELDVESGRLDFALAFADSRRSFSGSGEGTIKPDGEVRGDYTVVSADGVEISGSMNGTMDATGGCGNWINRAGQGGPWQVGALGKPARAEPEEESPFEMEAAVPAARGNRR